ncbi:DUF421 domain-containing protein [Spelaeicoccus albus]|uniref:Uncharacterized membrane protein YcaP (DUF421 family) n=1 Tax=Spelaeicoccus albus TaxID=1280376 RepID=A0A7Z0AB07_9MICO|nr:YetF domain-containing protein [Spelaeicoccus albus]NYI66530.1 uncharacterized membrane protein YcaP (DUF421 family) [Spelaeicoccus albus]
MWHAIGITPFQALEVIAATVGVYCAVLLLIRLLGQRAIATMSNFDMAAVLALGAVAGRATLGYTPTMAAGIIALVTLFCLHAAVGQIRRFRGGDHMLTNKPVVLVAGSNMIHDNLVRMHVTPDEVHVKLRLAGIRSMNEVACVTLESTGEISILRRGELIDPELLESVRGSEHVPAELVRHA